MKQEKYISNSFTVSFSKQEKIRRQANVFEDALIEMYPSIQVLPIPDNVDPQIPRIIFDSRHGFSQIIISQSSISLNVNYSDDYQNDVVKIKVYLKERIDMLYHLLKLADIDDITFSGLMTKIYLYFDNADDDLLISKITDCFGIKYKSENLNELEFRMAKIKENKFFSNIKIRNFRGWPLPDIADQSKLKASNAIARGVEVIGDYNDRFSYNEIDNYKTNLQAALEILEKGIFCIEKISSKIN